MSTCLGHRVHLHGKGRRCYLHPPTLGRPHSGLTWKVGYLDWPAWVQGVQTSTFPRSCVLPGTDTNEWNGWFEVLCNYAIYFLHWEKQWCTRVWGNSTQNPLQLSWVTRLYFMKVSFFAARSVPRSSSPDRRHSRWSNTDQVALPLCTLCFIWSIPVFLMMPSLLGKGSYSREK